MAVDDFPLPIEFQGQVFRFLKNSYSFTSQLHTGVTYPPDREHEIDFQVVSTKDHPVLSEL